jgi:hypothetical protein
MRSVALAQGLPGQQAARALAGLWVELDEDATVARLAVAHTLADRQDDPDEELSRISVRLPSRVG